MQNAIDGVTDTKIIESVEATMKLLREKIEFFSLNHDVSVSFMDNLKASYYQTMLLYHELSGGDYFLDDYKESDPDGYNDGCADFRYRALVAHGGASWYQGYENEIICESSDPAMVQRAVDAGNDWIKRLQKSFSQEK